MVMPRLRVGDNDHALRVGLRYFESRRDLLDAAKEKVPLRRLVVECFGFSHVRISGAKSLGSSP